jgi:trehalose 6-phosphate synthase
MINDFSTTKNFPNTCESTPGRPLPSQYELDQLLTRYSAWWGESFVTELRRISESSDRKVQYGSRPVTGTGPIEKKPDDAANGTPLKQEDGIPSKDKESDPAAAVEADKEPSGSMDKDLPLQPKKSATQ